MTNQFKVTFTAYNRKWVDYFRVIFNSLQFWDEDEWVEITKLEVGSNPISYLTEWYGSKEYKNVKVVEQNESN